MNKRYLNGNEKKKYQIVIFCFPQLNRIADIAKSVDYLFFNFLVLQTCATAYHVQARDQETLEM